MGDEAYCRLPPPAIVYRRLSLPVISLHLNQLNIEYKGGERRNLRSGTPLSIGKAVRDEEAVLGSLLHQLYTFCPAGDDLIQAECSRFLALVRTVEDRPVNQRTLIVAYHLIGCRRSLAVPFLQNLVLQTRRQCDDSFLLGILCKEGLACRLCGLACCSRCRLLLRLLFTRDLKQIEEELSLVKRQLEENKGK